MQKKLLVVLLALCMLLSVVPFAVSATETETTETVNYDDGT